MRAAWSRADVLGIGATVLSVVLALCLPLLVDLEYFFRGDTQSAYYGWWFHVGEELRSGTLPVFDAQTWRAGNFAAEGQWAILNPVVWGLGLLATVCPWVLGLATTVKFVLACFGSVGCYVLARSYGAHPLAAYVAGLVSVLGGMTLWLELPSWVAGLTIWSLMPWTWWAIRRSTVSGSHPFLALLFCYLLVTTGYVYGPLMLVVVLVGLAVETLASGVRRRVLALLAVTGFCGLLAVAVYLPGLLTMESTIRVGDVLATDGRLTTTPVEVLTSFLPTSGAEGGFEQQVAWRYAGWFMPLLVLVRWQSVRRDWRILAGPLLAVALTVVILNGPASIGPLRWPMRLEPFLVQFLAILLAVLLSRYRASLTRTRLAAGLGWVGGAAVWLTVGDQPNGAEHLVGGALVAGAFLVVGSLIGSRPRAATAVAAAVTFGIVALQLAWFPTPPSDQRNLPRDLAGYRTQLATAEGDVFVVGQQDNRIIEDPALTAEVLAGSMWYLNPHPVQNTYTTISFRTYYDRYCIRVHGQTCPEVLATLFSVEPTTDRLRIDLLSVSTLLLIKADVGSPPVPQGWHLSEETDRTVTWVRDVPLPTAGGPVWSSEGTTVHAVRVDDRTVELEVDSVPAAGGQVVLSRLDWPGYRTSLGSFSDPVDDYLLTLDLPADAEGKTVTVRFDPPGWRLELLCLALALGGGVAWSAAALVRRRRR